MGIGLSVCQRLIEAHGGTISAENHPGEGAAFTFRLPRILKNLPA
jgi:two-component system sensor kinase FixL